ncbi:uncharacterized protein LOC143298577 [Babylonia areolata]|uniref:uncharacterized protein LOC143298577 n=1 Tax=Babylonia areolata TaxID=304850 RepID=UPI003FD566D0
MAGLHAMCAVLIWGWVGGGMGQYVHEMYARKDDTNRSVACGVCEGRGGHLARRPGMDDWEILFGNWSHLENATYWVDLVKTDTGQWVWGDGQPLDLSNINALPMASGGSGSGSGSGSADWSCAVWNVVEPFLMVANCSMATNILCQLPATGTASGCTFRDLPGMSITSAGPTAISGSITDQAQCLDGCKGTSGCWAGDWNPSTQVCRHLLGYNATTRPTLPTLGSDANSVAFGKTCLHYQEMSPEDSEFVCNCGAIEIPETEEEKEQFLEEHKEEVQKELIVPTATLSATIRKKESAPDERPSSTSIGFLGISLIVIVFGSLVLLDLTSLLAHIKLAATNVKTVLVDEEETASSEA